MPLLFSEYLQKDRVAVAQFRSGMALEMSCPFEIRPTHPNGKAVLLIHGLLASPYIMRSIGAWMAEHGYLVRAIRLSGHGTDYTQLRQVHYPDWLATCRYGIETLQAEAGINEISAIGFSLGAILALMLSFEFKLRGLGLIAPCFEISALTKLFPTLCKLKLDRILPDLFCTQSEPINWGSYSRFPIHAVAELQKLLRDYRTQAAQQKTWPPIFGAASLDDHTVKTSATIEAFQTFPAAHSHLKLYTAADFAQTPHIITLSHVALPVAPTDPYFGKEGEYYGVLPPETQFGEPTWRDKYKPIKRLTYNPDFQNMMSLLLPYV